MFRVQAMEKLATMTANYLHVIAIVMLAVAGGTYSHSSQIDHKHSNAISTINDLHSHIQQKEDRIKFADQSTIHCGSSICVLVGDNSPKIKILNAEKIQTDFIFGVFLSFTLDPPPPRFFS